MKCSGQDCQGFAFITDLDCLMLMHTILLLVSRLNLHGLHFTKKPPYYSNQLYDMTKSFRIEPKDKGQNTHNGIKSGKSTVN